jgi:hypothetical protein
MEISNNLISNFFIFWIIAYLIGLSLIFIRKDFSLILKDVNRFLYLKNVLGFLISLILLTLAYFILIPISIPFSIKNIINQKK